MELYTLQRVLIPSTTGGLPKIKFVKKDSIEEFSSLIWTERYYGNGDFQLVCPLTMEYLEKLPKGGYLGLDDSRELMRIQNVTVENKVLTITGVSILPWLNHRFIRAHKSHKNKSWTFKNINPNLILWQLLQNGINFDGTTLSEGNTDIFADYLQMLQIPEIGLHDLDTSGDPVSMTVDYGPLYDVMAQVAGQYGIGMQLLLQDDEEFEALGFRTYKGLNRTHSQDSALPQNDIVTFSKATDSLSNPKEIYSVADSKTLIFAFGSNLDTDLGLEHGSHNSGVAWVSGMDANNPEAWGLNCQAEQLFVDELSGYPSPLPTTDIIDVMTMLNLAAVTKLRGSAPVGMVDGQIVSTNKYVYGRDYRLGDLVEIEGDSGLTSIGVVTEYIRSQDNTGEQAFPSVSLIDSANRVNTRFDLVPAPNNPYDDICNAFEITLQKVSQSGPWIGKANVAGNNLDCTTDRVDDLDDTSQNRDWLTNEFGYPDATGNWRTTWYKWLVPNNPGDVNYFSTNSKLKVWLTDYDVGMVLVVLVPARGKIPSSGPIPKSDQGAYRSFGFDVTEKGKPPYDPLFCWVDVDIWGGHPTSSGHSDYVFIGVGTPPLSNGTWGQGVNSGIPDRGSEFRLHLQYWEDYPSAKKAV